MLFLRLFMVVYCEGCCSSNVVVLVLGRAECWAVRGAEAPLLLPLPLKARFFRSSSLASCGYEWECLIAFYVSLVAIVLPLWLCIREGTFWGLWSFVLIYLQWLKVTTLLLLLPLREGIGRLVRTFWEFRLVSVIAELIFFYSINSLLIFCIAFRILVLVIFSIRCLAIG